MKIARGLKFWNYEVEGLFFLCCENKGADQCLCFPICKSRFSHDTASCPAFYRDSVINGHFPFACIQVGQLAHYYLLCRKAFSRDSYFKKDFQMLLAVKEGSLHIVHLVKIKQ